MLENVKKFEIFRRRVFDKKTYSSNLFHNKILLKILKKKLNKLTKNENHYKKIVCGIPLVKRFFGMILNFFFGIFWIIYPAFCQKYNKNFGRKKN